MKELEIKSNLETKICNVKFKNPLIAASGCFSYGREYEKYFDLENLGGISTKGTTLNERIGNPPPRVAETPMGMLNSVGLENPGLNFFISNHLPYLLGKNTVIIVNIAGHTVAEYKEIARRLDKTSVQMIELNISCPNVKSGGQTFGVSCQMVESVVKEVRAQTKLPLIVKLSPNVTSIADIAKAAVSGGADCLSVINTLTGMKIDINSRRPILKNNIGGLSGPAVFPIALRAVWEVSKAVDVPIIGLGGISKASDAIEMMIAGATAFQVGTAFFNDPFVFKKILRGIDEFLIKENVKNINDIIGTIKPY